MFRPREGMPPSSRDMERLLKTVYGIRGRNGIRCYVDYDGIVVDGVAGLDLSKFAFGWVSASGQTVTIAVGYVEGRYGYRTVGQTVVSVGGNASAKHLIIATGDATSAAVEVNSVLESAYTGDAVNQWRRVLYRVYLANGRPVMDMIGGGVGGIVL